MDEIKAYRALTGEIFTDEKLCLERDVEYADAFNDARRMVLSFEHHCLSHDVGHCGPRDCSDRSEATDFHRYKEKLYSAMALWRLIGRTTPVD